jgi:hypothetical protein
LTIRARALADQAGTRRTRKSCSSKAPHRLAIEADAGTQLGVVAKLASHLSERREQLGKALQLIDRGDLAHVALQNGVEVAVRPCMTAVFAASMQRLGVAAGEHPLLQGLGHLGGCLVGRWRWWRRLGRQGREQGIDPGAGVRRRLGRRARLRS